MIKRYWNSLMHTIGLIAIVFFIITMIFPDIIELRSINLVMCIILPSHLFTFLTFNLRLFSKHIWIRRIIVMLFYIFDAFLMHFIFGRIRFEMSKNLIILAVAMGIYIIISVFAYYVGDKTEKRDLEAINRKLTEQISIDS